ncbi:hypothetical protein GCM10009867_30270 [Pedococcus aerophilus]|uniref:Uncharacterized protein n=1 Tax=Pedococcus aerophilus TaxID=436356 RepID=A0ABN3UVM8_9MICO
MSAAETTHATSAAPPRGGTRSGASVSRALGLSPSQLGLRAALVAASVALVALTLVAAPHGLVVGAVVLVVLSGWAALRPESAGSGLLVAGLALHWVGTVPVPATTGAWLRLLGAALLLLVVHLTAALAASLPPAAPVPAASLRRWSRRAATVAVGTVPLWALALGADRARAAGDITLSYAAIGTSAVLALAIWLLSRDARR